jgi:hypothetical protein
VTHGDGLLVGHVEVDRKSNETTAFQPLLAPRSRTGPTMDINKSGEAVCVGSLSRASAAFLQSAPCQATALSHWY